MDNVGSMAWVLWLLLLVDMLLMIVGAADADDAAQLLSFDVDPALIPNSAQVAAARAAWQARVQPDEPEWDPAGLISRPRSALPALRPVMCPSQLLCRCSTQIDAFNFQSRRWGQAGGRANGPLARCAAAASKAAPATAVRW